MVQARKAGIDPLRFWILTPYEIWVCIEAHYHKLEDLATLLDANAWQTAYLGRVKRMPGFDEWVNRNRNDDKKRKGPMTDEEKEEYLREWEEKCKVIEALVNGTGNG